MRHYLHTKPKTNIDQKSKAEVGRGVPGLSARVPEFGRGVMMGVYVQDWMGLDGGTQKQAATVTDARHSATVRESCQCFLAVAPLKRGQQNVSRFGKRRGFCAGVEIIIVRRGTDRSKAGS